ncbi:hypothetical protein [Sphingomonas oligophenolica]|uniref:hypothetical protein n=1 Tax=Sphingomonas oligophenolica TaxID=301154 RepID=UPI001F4F893B|nr:hypothetical protein [Sphingomonas oligophenolica]
MSSNKAQLRAISSSIIAQLLAALQGGRVAGDTFRHIATRRAAAAAPISDEQDSILGRIGLAVATAMTFDGGGETGLGATAAVA